MFLESLEALRGLRGAADKAVRRAVVWAPLLAAVLGGASPARAAAGRLNIDIDIRAVANVIDLTAVPGSSTGTISLSWTEPYHTSGVAPYSYDVRVSSVVQISNDAGFLAAAPLSAVSPDAPPAPGAGGGAAGFVVTGLTPDVTYYFAIREKDSTAVHGAWVRTAIPSRNQNNFAIATSTRPPAPAGGFVTDVQLSSVAATWSVSPAATDYVLVASTGSANPPVQIAASSTTLTSTAAVSGLGPNTTYFLFVSACGGGCSAWTALGSTITLAAPAVGLSTTSLSSSTASLAWDPNGDPPGTLFQVLRSTDGASFASAASVAAPGASIAGLTGGVTYYFLVVAVNGSGIPAAPSNLLTVVTPTGPTPSAPSGLTATGGLLSVALAWNALPPSQQGVGLLYYELSRSPSASFGFVRIATTTGTSFVDRPLAAGTTYFYRIAARDLALTASAPSAAVPAVPYSLAPMEPLGTRVGSSSTTVTFSWSPTARFDDGSPFLSTGAPAADELIGYAVYRSTDICNPSYVQLSTMAASVTGLTDVNNGLNYYYRVYSFNSIGLSQNTVTLSALGERNYFIDGCRTTLVLDDATANGLNGSSNGVGDIRILSEARPQDLGNGVFQSASWRAFRDGAVELKGYALPKPARVVLHFNVSGGVPVPAARGFAARDASAPAASGVNVNDLGVYWNNGAEFKKMYGRVDAAAQTVTVQSPNLGVYQVRALARSSGVVFDLSNLSSRVITPNGDGRNDVAIFTYDPGPAGVAAEGRIFDLNGAFVADMAPGLVPNTLTWDGRMNGRPASSGVYMYRLSGGGKTFTGTIVVAK